MNTKDIECIIVDYFHQHFKLYRPTDVGSLLEYVHLKVISAQNQHLTRSMSSEDIHHALFQIHSSKVPRPDGIPLLFFQKYWNFIFNNIIHMVKCIFPL